MLPSVTVYTLPMVTNSGYTLDHYIITPGNTYTVQKVNKERLHRTATRQVRKGRGGGCRQFRGFYWFAGNIPAAITRAGKMPVCCRFYAAPEPEARSRPGAALGGFLPGLSIRTCFFYLVRTDRTSVAIHRSPYFVPKPEKFIVDI